jgi:hypothetical protein
VDVYDSEYRRQYCRERVARIRDDYRRAEAPPTDSQRRMRVMVQMRAMVNRVRQAPRREPAYRS